MLHERCQLSEKLPSLAVCHYHTYFIHLSSPLLIPYSPSSSPSFNISPTLVFHSQGSHWTFLFTHLCSSAIFLLHLSPLSLSLSGISLMLTGKWGTNKTQNPRHRKSLNFGINLHTILHTLHWQVYKCVLLSTWQYPDESGNIQGRPILTGLNMHQFFCYSWSWCSLPFCPGGTSCNNPSQNGNAKLNPYRLFGLASVFVLPKTQIMIKVMLLTMPLPAR